MPTQPKTFTILLLAVVAASCTRPNPAYRAGDGDEACAEDALVVQSFDEFSQPSNLDILFVVDGSDDGRRTARRLLADAIAPLRGALPEIDIQAAVLPSDRARLTGPVSRDNCDSDDPVTSLAGDALRCNILETTTDGVNRPLDTVTKFLADPEDHFPRKDARLLVVIVSRSDDASEQSPRELVTSWSTLPDAPETIALAVVAGPPSAVAEERPVCSGTAGSIFAANRLYRAASALGERGSFASLCSDDLSVPLAAAAQRLIDGPLSLCVDSTEPFEVLHATVDGEVVAYGSDGFVYLGATDDCPTGAVSLHRSVVDGADAIELTYCTE